MTCPKRTQPYNNDYVDDDDDDDDDDDSDDDDDNDDDDSDDDEKDHPLGNGKQTKKISVYPELKKTLYTSTLGPRNGSDSKRV